MLLTEQRQQITCLWDAQKAQFRTVDYLSWDLRVFKLNLTGFEIISKEWAKLSFNRKDE